MADVYYVDPESGGSCYLIVGSKIVVIDPGMAYNGDHLIEKIRTIIGGRRVDAVLLTHSHYDHAGAVPFIRHVWPDVTVMAQERAAYILQRPGAQKTIRRLSEEAAQLHGAVLSPVFSEDQLAVDRVIEDGEMLDFGDFTMQVIACPGHTQDSVSFLMDGHTLFAAETIGLPNQDRYTPEFLVSWKTSLESLNKCRSYPVETLCLAHFGIFKDPEGSGMWQWMEDGLYEVKDSLIRILREIPDEEGRMAVMEEKYWNSAPVGGIPRGAFHLNAQAMLKTIGEEFADEIGKE